MVRKLYGRGAHGAAVQMVQQALRTAGFDPGGVDGWFGGKTEQAVLGFQAARRLAATGSVDSATWTALVEEPIPSLFQRSLELTAAFEGHDYWLAMGNYDGAWLTWGVIGFTLKSGSLAEVVLNVEERHAGLVKEAFDAYGEELLAMMEASLSRQRKWAQELTVARGLLAREWRLRFERFGRMAEVQEEQRRVARERYWQPATRTAERVGLQSELGLALCFDVHVQNGGVKRKAEKEIGEWRGTRSRVEELKLRELVGRKVAESARKRYRADVLTRKLTIARGRGRVHGTEYALENWGLGEYEAESGEPPASSSAVA